SDPYVGVTWALRNTGQPINSGTAGLAGADAKVIDAYSRLNNPQEGIVDLNSGQNLIAILDTGVRLTHEEFDASQFVDGYDYVDNDSDPTDEQGHGTHVAGTAAAQINDVGTFGSNPNAKIMPIRVLDENGSGYTSDVWAGVEYAAENGAKVINMSLGGERILSWTEFNFYNYIYQNYDVLIVAAAGNIDPRTENPYNGNEFDYSYSDLIPTTDNPYGPKNTYPASIPVPNILSVGNSTNEDSYNPGSHWGPGVDLYAPGTNIYSASHLADNEYKYDSGTSMAAPLVAGIASAYWSRLPELSADQVKYALMSSVETSSPFVDSASQGRVDMDSLFYGPYSQSANMASSSSEISIAASDRTKPLMEDIDLDYQVTAENINAFSRNELNNEFLAVLEGNDEQRLEIATKINDLISVNDSIFSDIKFDTIGDSFIGVFDLESANNFNRKKVLKTVLENGWVEGFDLNRTVSLNPPITEESVNLPNNEVPSYIDPTDYDGLIFIGELDNDISKSNTSDYISAGDGADSVLGGKGDDYLNGGKGHDNLTGNNGTDTIRGGSGSDFINGGNGNDQLIGGAGNDTFKFSKGTDVIKDFELSEDAIHISDDSVVEHRQVSNGLRLSLDGANQQILILEGIKGVDYSLINFTDNM
ncbi:S8 family serine peptidase, partial [bacterium]|nr:S8 family serine peptidase [bacterium]